jgi:hypothetical protein
MPGSIRSSTIRTNLAARFFNGLLPGRRQRHGVAVARQVVADQLQDVFLVVDDQNVLFGHAVHLAE